MCILCEKCTKMCAGIVLIVGILFLLQDLGVWAFWNISWYTAGFILAGLGAFCSAGCPMCVAAKKKK